MRQVDVYSFSMIAYQLFELCPPFAGMDPVDAARKAALAEERPPLMRLATKMPTMAVRHLFLSLDFIISLSHSYTSITTYIWTHWAAESLRHLALGVPMM